MYTQCTCFIFCFNICDLVYMPPAITCRILVKKIKYDYKQESKYDELTRPLQHDNTDLALFKLLNCIENAINQLYLCNILTPLKYFLKSSSKICPLLYQFSLYTPLFWFLQFSLSQSLISRRALIQKMLPQAVTTSQFIWQEMELQLEERKCFMNASPN